MSTSKKRGTELPDMAMHQGAEDAVRIMLGAAGLPADAAEICGQAAKYRDFRAAIDALYAVPAVRYADPALRFDAHPGREQWGDSSATAGLDARPCDEEQGR
ncbi:hypothetical protein [Nocardia altamirensis]|uniref:hypothetical protein n=1 Tax=Nocardia altamirensis TaxID=472158 RepID=UPI000840052A|nr:hypothetical protein [Nocardia altamirensis]